MKNTIIMLAAVLLPFYSVEKEKTLPSWSNDKTVIAAQKKEQILYLFFTIEKKVSEKITLKQSKIAEGRIRTFLGFDEARVQEGDFVVTLTGADGKEIVKQAVQDPLHPVMEVYDIKEIKRFKASLQRAEFSLRFPYSENVRYVKIEKKKGQDKKLLFTQKL
ncbi:hypothetical protein ACR1PO_03340 [Chryseobacterium sp. RRHN12]|uniref:hypothetical protein n=1 Tax=Chryseobacterium sp. RRHN12 TaxID=3437884 RepID=UPI003D9BA757